MLQNKINQNKTKQNKTGDLVAFRAARRALSAKRVPRWRGDVADIALGEGGVRYAVSDDVVVKVVAIDGDYTEYDMFTADITKNPFREVAIYQRSNRLVAKGLTDHVAMMLDARKVRKVRNVRNGGAETGAGTGPELHLYLERFDSSCTTGSGAGSAQRRGAGAPRILRHGTRARIPPVRLL
jgi:hypothetical protein